MAKAKWEQEHRLQPMNEIAGFSVRPGFYRTMGALSIPGGVSFTIASEGATACELLLYHRGEKEPYAELPFPQSYRIGRVYSMIVFGLDPTEFEYAYRFDGPNDPARGLLFDKDKTVLDPYARAVTGQSQWGVRLQESGYRARVVIDNFDWGDTPSPHLPMEDLVIYEMHVRGFSEAAPAVKHPGTFAGLEEKIPYLKKLGVNAVELMPIFEFDELAGRREVDGQTLVDYWGYNTVAFFAPNTSYAAEKEYNREGLELKKLIRTLHENGIEVILDVVFNHTAEGDEHGPCISFKGMDNNIYYMLTPDGHYYNFSGCGNTVNCNHPVVREMIADCLRYWVETYRVDGFRFDLASILGRSEDGAPMERPPLLQTLAVDPLLRDTKLIAEAWDAGGLYQVGQFPSFRRWSEWNGKYRDDMRRFLKGDTGLAGAAAQRVTGSTDLYDPNYRGTHASVNFLTCHDGFTLYDLYAYNEKHNEKNGWNNTDGANDNNSWNCGAEGETDDAAIGALRLRLMRNALTVLLASRGTPMLLAGDEFANTQQGNNNTYCQDSPLSWLDWARGKQFAALTEYVSFLTAFRAAHPVLRAPLAPSAAGLPDTSIHGETPFQPDFGPDSRRLCVLFAGRVQEQDDIVYLMMNMHWEPGTFRLPPLPKGLHWAMAADAAAGKTYLSPQRVQGDTLTIEGRAALLLTAQPDK